MQQKTKKRQAMVRKQLFITVEQQARLRSLAADTGSSEASLIRDGLELVIQHRTVEAEDWKAGVMNAFGAWKDDRETFERIAQSRKLRRELWQRRERCTHKLMDGD